MDDNFEKLNQVNYTQWSIRMRSLLKLKNCLGAIEFNPGTLTEEQRKEDEKCKSLLYLSVDNVNFDSIEECTTANQIWNKLKKIHTKFDCYHDVLVLKEFFNLKKGHNENILEYFNRRDHLYNQVHCAGFDLENKVLMALMLIGLPKEFESLIRTIQIHDKSFTLASLKIKVAEEERRLADDTKNNAIEYVEVMISQQKMSRQEIHLNETPCNSNSYSQIKTEEIELKFEDLHHSIDIKEETSIIECQLDEDSKRKTSTKPFTCELCGYKCAHKGNLNTHLRTHTGQKPFRCELCDYECARKDTLTTHLFTHTGDRPFSCKICDYKCAHKAKLKIHVRTHTGQKPFSCEICGYKCAQKDYLKIHLKTHSGDKPFSCELCDYKCTLSGKLKNHLRTHTGAKPFSCEICSYKCAQKVNLKTHLKIHSGEKPFSCPICTYKCTRKENLNQHLKTHTGEKPFGCEICGYKSTQRGNLKVHLKTHT